jgi:hypothetical protein
LTGNLKEDIKLDLTYSWFNLGMWDENVLKSSLKYSRLIGRRAFFYNKLSITPGLGLRFCKNLEFAIPNFGTLIELYETVDKNLFFALLYNYADINSRSLNMIYDSCKNYSQKYGTVFVDVSFYKSE